MKLLISSATVFNIENDFQRNSQQIKFRSML